MTADILRVLCILLLVCLSAFFSGSEIALSSSSELRLRHRMEDKKGKRGPALACRLHEQYESALTTILIGNNLVNIAASSIATVMVLETLGDGYAWVATVVMTVVILIFGEILPKIVAKQEPEKYSSLVAVPLSALQFVLKPAIFLVTAVVRAASRLWQSQVPEGPSVTEDDLEKLIETVGDEGVMDEDECDLLQSALDFDDVLAYEIITPRVDLIAIDIDDDYDEIIKTALAADYSRLPVYEDTIDNVIGILHLNHLLKSMVAGGKANIRELMMPVQFVHKTMSLSDVLSVMKNTKSHMVVVNDEYGGVMGVLTMEDVLEQLVGDIWDESDVIESELTELSPGLYDVSGDMRVLDLLSELDVDDRDFDSESATLGGFAIETLDAFPKVGDSFDYKNLHITVRRMRKRRVIRLTVQVMENKDEDDQHDHDT